MRTCKMKKLAVILTLVFGTSFLVAQTFTPRPQSVSADQYAELKKEGKLSSGLYVMRADQNAVPLKYVVQPPSNPQTIPANCNCLIPLDATFQVVPFYLSSPPDYRNDDGTTALINLPFSFCFYGNIQNSLYINNNGNISFGTSCQNVLPVTFPTTAFSIIAPFWADVDTRNFASGLVYYKITPTSMIVKWENVGYYSQHADKLNTFQLIITDGTDPLLPPGANVGFCYGDMQWTTGDASGGVGGFGGTAATVGCNIGDGINFIQLGRYDQPGLTYNGPFGVPGGVDWLDNKQFFLDACSTGGGGNIPPIMNAALVCDTFTICVGDTIPIIAEFLSPENNQVTTASASTAGTGLSIISSTPGNPAYYNGIFVGLNSNIGVNTIQVSGTDNGIPSQTTSGNIIINVIAGPTASFTSVGICPGNAMPFTNLSTSVPGNGPLVSQHWDFGMAALTNDTSDIVSPTYVYNTPGTYQVTLLVVDSMGCKDTAQQNVSVFYLPLVSFSGVPTSGCAPLCVNFTDLTTVQNSSAAQWLWNFGNGDTDTLQNPAYCYSVNGMYTISLSVTSAQGCSFTNTVSNYINVIPGPQAAFTFGPQPATSSDPTINFWDQSTGNPAQWFWDFGTGTDSSAIQNPEFNYPDTGTYVVMLIVNTPNGNCPDTAYEIVVISPELLIWIPNAFTPNHDGKNETFSPVFSDPAYIVKYEMLIFDRWGNMIFKTEDPYRGWDGKTKNERAETDTYVFRVMVRGTDGVDHKYIGHVNLIR